MDIFIEFITSIKDILLILLGWFLSFLTNLIIDKRNTTRLIKNKKTENIKTYIYLNKTLFLSSLKAEYNFDDIDFGELRTELLNNAWTMYLLEPSDKQLIQEILDIFALKGDRFKEKNIILKEKLKVLSERFIMVNNE
ncbi:MAG: hypothetical protein ACRCWG_12395 [Sarcina sp.]